MVKIDDRQTINRGTTIEQVDQMRIFADKLQKNLEIRVTNPESQHKRESSTMPLKLTSSEAANMKDMEMNLKFGISETSPEDENYFENNEARKSEKRSTGVNCSNDSQETVLLIK